MCTTCGCGHAHTHTHTDEKGHTYTHSHTDAHHDHHLNEEIDERTIAVEEDILSRNNHIAMHNRDFFRQGHILALNLVSSPGSGKTEILCQTIKALKDQPLCVVEGDQQTECDADRIRSTGAKAHQINTGKGCHLDASMIAQTLDVLTPEKESFFFIENVGNLVCPAEFDLGEAHKVVILSVTEGEDKPIKYPDMFRASDLMIINKVDLLPYVQFDIEKCEAYARQVNPNIKIIRFSATTLEGLPQWLTWLNAQLTLASL